MFKCRECNATFRTPVKVTESYGEKWHVCPYCGSERIEEAEKVCELCGDYYADSLHDGVCDGCIEIIGNRFKELLHANFTPFEISVINSVYEGRNLE